MVNSESVVGIKPSDSDMTGWWIYSHLVDEELHCSITHLSWFLRQGVNTNPLEPQCEDYSFMDQEVKGFGHGLNFILTDSVNTPELDVSFDEANVMPFSFSSEFPSLVNAISDDSRVQLAPSIISQKIWCQARVPLLPVPLVDIPQPLN